MSAYSNHRPIGKPIGNESIQFTFNKKPFSTRDRAVDALCAKNLLPAEPAVAFYYDDKKKLNMLLAIGSFPNTPSPLFIEDKEAIIENSSIGETLDYVEQVKANAGTVLLDDDFDKYLNILYQNASTWAEATNDVKDLIEENKIQNASINALENIVIDGSEVELE